MNRVRFSIVVCTLIWQAAIFQQPAMAEGSLGDSVDCTDVSIDYTDDPGLTREERLRLMDEAFVESLNRFELCQSAKKRAKAAGGGTTAGSGASGGVGGGAKGDSDNPGDGSGGGLTGDAGVSSVASSTMSGTEPPPEVSPSEGIGTQEAARQGGQDMAAPVAKTNTNVTSANGKLPEDIPPAANDDALAAQIRYAAENEPDPVKAAQLWNEYRKYKGMTPKN
jgi:hypothetical protein